MGRQIASFLDQPVLSTALACAIHLRLSFIAILIGHVSRREMLINRDFDNPSNDE